MENQDSIQTMKDVLIYLRDNVVHGQQRYVDMINSVLEEGV